MSTRSLGWCAIKFKETCSCDSQIFLLELFLLFHTRLPNLLLLELKHHRSYTIWRNSLCDYPMDVYIIKITNLSFSTHCMKPVPSLRRINIRDFPCLRSRCTHPLMITLLSRLLSASRILIYKLINFNFHIIHTE